MNLDIETHDLQSLREKYSQVIEEIIVRPYKRTTHLVWKVLHDDKWITLTVMTSKDSDVRVIHGDGDVFPFYMTGGGATTKYGTFDFYRERVAFCNRISDEIVLRAAAVGFPVIKTMIDDKVQYKWQGSPFDFPIEALTSQIFTVREYRTYLTDMGYILLNDDEIPLVL